MAEERQAEPAEAGLLEGWMAPLPGWLLLAALLLALILVPFLLWDAAITGWSDDLLDGRLGSGAVAVAIAGLLVVDVFLPVPSSVLSTAAGFELGFVAGTLVSWAGMSIGAFLGYAFGWLLGHGPSARIVGGRNLQRARAAMHRNAAWVLAVARPVPILAEASVLVAGATRMRATPFLGVTVLANLGISLAYAWIGARSADTGSFLLAFAAAVAVPLLAAIGARLWARRQKTPPATGDRWYLPRSTADASRGRTMSSQAVTTDLDEARETLIDLLGQAAQIEHLLADQYLFAAFSLKKYPEEFGCTDGNVTEDVWAQVEHNRRWEAMTLFTARQEMEHLALVQNLRTILGEKPYLWSPNYPVPAKSYPLGVPFHLMRFTRHAIETFRFYEKPDSLKLPNPFEGQDFERTVPKHEIHRTHFHSVQQLYEEIQRIFDRLLQHQDVIGQNPNRIVAEHYGFNIELSTIVQGDYQAYVDNAVAEIIEQGEGVGEVPPPLGSHFMAYQNILDDMRRVEPPTSPMDDWALPVVDDPALEERYHVGKVTLITEPYTRRVVELYNRCYQLQCRMLTGFFAQYDIDQTTGIRPPVPNAYFRTVFYPMMTMVMRPLGEVITRLPAFEGYEPVPGELPAATAGPTFEIAVEQGPGHGDEKAESVAPPDDPRCYFPMEIERASADARALARDFPWDGVIPLGGRPFPERLTYLSENLWRMGVNFRRYWDGEIVAPIPSKDFQNFNQGN